MDKILDLRSDTVTKPVPGMRKAMAEAEVGDDGFGDDPTVNRLEERMAEILGKDAAVFVPSGTMGNEVSIHVLSKPGTEVVVEAGSHIFNHEVAAASCISGVQLRPVDGDGGLLSAQRIKACIRPERLPLPRTSLICLENTHNRSGGRLHPIGSMREIRALSLKDGIPLHLDGARLFNAEVASGIPVSEFATLADAVTVCFSKGLGSPVGSMLAGSKAFVDEARRIRRMLGGGMRQVGVLAAACLYAIDNHRERLADDHENAGLLAGLVKENASTIDVDPYPPETNIVIFTCGKSEPDTLALCNAIKERGVLLVPFGGDQLRAVAHLGVTKTDVSRAAEVIAAVAADFTPRNQRPES
jgi:threonine aldolase